MQVRSPATGFSQEGISVNAIAGTNVVFFGINAEEPALIGLLGFAVRRIDFLETGQPGSDRWLSGRKVFKSIMPNPPPNREFETKLHPIQSFVWSDYRAKPGYLYKYFVHPMYGTPAIPQLGPAVEISIRTEDDDNGTHAVFFNRGAIASQAFAQKFPELQDMSGLEEEQLDDPKHKATEWLSRGLLDAALKFISTTKPNEQLRVAAYEFSYTPFVKELLAAHQRGIDVKIIHEAGTERKKNPQTGITETVETSATKAAKAAIAAHGLPDSILIPRTNRKAIPHNKFMVKLRDGNPHEVWTGSTNFTMSGFLGQANCGHVVREPGVAAEYLAYWVKLADDPVEADFRPWIMENSPNPPESIPPGTTTLFSPRTNSKMLAWYADRLRETKSAVFFTAAFGLNLSTNKLHKAIAEPAVSMRFLLLEKPDPQVAALHAADPNFIAAVGAGLGLDQNRRPLPGWELANWFEERHFRKTGHVFFVHQKFLLLDPLGNDPVVISGSANFSPNSLLANDENMLLIRGDQRVAHAYFTEFDRLFRHFLYRNAANADDPDSVNEKKFLDEDERWTKKHFAADSYQDRRRRLFA